MAGVIAKWQDGTATLLYLELADVIAMWQDVKATLMLYMATNKMQQTWGTSILQRRCYHQKPPDGPQGPRSNAGKEWGHLYI